MPDRDYDRACEHFREARRLRACAAAVEGETPPFDWCDPVSDWLCRQAEIHRALGRFYRGLHDMSRSPHWAKKRLREAMKP